MQAVEAYMDEQGVIHLLGNVSVKDARRVTVVVHDEPPVFRADIANGQKAAEPTLRERVDAFYATYDNRMEPEMTDMFVRSLPPGEEW